MKEVISSLKLENEKLKKKMEELDLKVTEVDVGLTIVKEKSLSDMPLIQITPSASGYSWAILVIMSYRMKHQLINQSIFREA